MPHFAQELMLLARLGLSRAALALPAAGAAVRARQFVTSVQAAMPELSTAQAHRLHQRYRMSMRKFTLIKDHLSTLEPAALASFVERHVQVDGLEHLDAVKASAAPVVFVTPHYGSFPLACLKLIQYIGRQKTVNAFYNPPSTNRSSEGFEELFQGLGFGFNALFNDDKAVLKALRVLKRGEALTMMPDVFDISGHVLYVPFFGKLVPAMAGTALFALKSQATVIVGYGCPGSGLNSTLKLGRPLAVERTGQLDVDIANLTAAIFRDMEAQIRHMPEHWVYLKGIGDLLDGRLALGQPQGQDWLSALEAGSAQFQARLPEWAGVLNVVADMHRSRTAPCCD